MSIDTPRRATTSPVRPGSPELRGDQTGTSIIAGHTGHTGGGALDDLERMSPGDEVDPPSRPRCDGHAALMRWISSSGKSARGKIAWPPRPSVLT